MADIAYALPPTDKLFDGLLSGLKRFTEDLSSGTTDSGACGYRWRGPLPASPGLDAGGPPLRPAPALRAKLRPEEGPGAPRPPSQPAARPRSRPGARPRAAAQPARAEQPPPPARQRCASPRPPPAPGRQAACLAVYGPLAPLASPPPRPAPNATRLALCIPRAFQRSLSLEPLSARTARTEPLLEPARAAALRAPPNSARGPVGASPPAAQRSAAPPALAPAEPGRPSLRASSSSAPKHRTLEEHVARASAKLLRAAGSPRLTWCTQDSEAEYRGLQPGDFFNHFQNNRVLTTKAGLAQSLAQHAVASGQDAESFFPRSYDMAQRSEREDFILDFRRSASVRIAALHLDLNGQRECGAAPAYCCNLDVLRDVERTLQRWCCDLDPQHLDEEEDSPAQGRAGVPEGRWDALVLYSELTAAQLCGEEEDGGVSRPVRRRYHRVGGGELADPADGAGAAAAVQGPRPSDLRCWPEFRSQRWGLLPPERCKALRALLLRLEALFPQFGLQGGSEGRNVWVAKPGSSSKGSGVECWSSLAGLLRHCDAMTDRVVQKYVERPLLLCGGRKFDIRQWVLVTSVAPLRAFIFSECYLRLCNSVYDLGALRDRERHLSNWQVNRNGRHAVEGAVQSLEDLQRELEACTGRPDAWEQLLLPQLQQLVLHTLRSAEGQLAPRERSFELYGFDLLLDEDLHLWLLEVNLSPGCEGRAPFLERLLERMARRLVEVAVLGREEPDGQLPDWLPLCDDAAGEGAGARAAAEAARRPAPERPADPGLVVHGQAVALPRRRPPRPGSGRRTTAPARPAAAAPVAAPREEAAAPREAATEEWEEPPADADAAAAPPAGLAAVRHEDAGEQGLFATEPLRAEASPFAAGSRPGLVPLLAGAGGPGPAHDSDPGGAWRGEAGEIAQLAYGVAYQSEAADEEVTQISNMAYGDDEWDDTDYAEERLSPDAASLPRASQASTPLPMPAPRRQNSEDLPPRGAANSCSTPSLAGIPPALKPRAWGEGQEGEWQELPVTSAGVPVFGAGSPAGSAGARRPEAWSPGPRASGDSEGGSLQPPSSLPGPYTERDQESPLGPLPRGRPGSAGPGSRGASEAGSLDRGGSSWLGPLAGGFAGEGLPPSGAAISSSSASIGATTSDGGSLLHGGLPTQRADGAAQDMPPSGALFSSSTASLGVTTSEGGSLQRGSWPNQRGMPPTAAVASSSSASLAAASSDAGGLHRGRPAPQGLPQSSALVTSSAGSLPSESEVLQHRQWPGPWLGIPLEEEEAHLRPDSSSPLAAAQAAPSERAGEGEAAARGASALTPRAARAAAASAAAELRPSTSNRAGHQAALDAQWRASGGWAAFAEEPRLDDGEDADFDELAYRVAASTALEGWLQGASGAVLGDVHGLDPAWAQPGPAARWSPSSSGLSAASSAVEAPAAAPRAGAAPGAELQEGSVAAPQWSSAASQGEAEPPRGLMAAAPAAAPAGSSAAAPPAAGGEAAPAAFAGEAAPFDAPPTAGGVAASQDEAPGAGPPAGEPGSPAAGGGRAEAAGSEAGAEDDFEAGEDSFAPGSEAGAPAPRPASAQSSRSGAGGKPGSGGAGGGAAAEADADAEFEDDFEAAASRPVSARSGGSRAGSEADGDGAKAGAEAEAGSDAGAEDTSEASEEGFVPAAPAGKPASRPDSGESSGSRASSASEDFEAAASRPVSARSGGSRAGSEANGDGAKAGVEAEAGSDTGSEDDFEAAASRPVSARSGGSHAGSKANGDGAKAGVEAEAGSDAGSEDDFEAAASRPVSARSGGSRAGSEANGDGAKVGVEAEAGSDAGSEEDYDAPDDSFEPDSPAGVSASRPMSGRSGGSRAGRKAHDNGAESGAESEAGSELGSKDTSEASEEGFEPASPAGKPASRPVSGKSSGSRASSASEDSSASVPRAGGAATSDAEAAGSDAAYSEDEDFDEDFDDDFEGESSAESEQ